MQGNPTADRALQNPLRAICSKVLMNGCALQLHLVDPTFSSDRAVTYSQPSPNEARRGGGL